MKPDDNIMHPGSGHSTWASHFCAEKSTLPWLQVAHPALHPIWSPVNPSEEMPPLPLSLGRCLGGSEVHPGLLRLFLLALPALSLGMCHAGVLFFLSPESCLLDLSCIPVMTDGSEETTRKLISPEQYPPVPKHDNSKYNK